MSVVVVWLSPVRRLSTVTVTPARWLPSSSVTVPTIFPTGVCAEATAVHVTKATTRVNWRRITALPASIPPLIDKLEEKYMSLGVYIVRSSHGQDRDFDRGAAERRPRHHPRGSTDAGAVAISLQRRGDLRRTRACDGSRRLRRCP